jgi:hypothetical protein
VTPAGDVGAGQAAPGDGSDTGGGARQNPGAPAQSAGTAGEEPGDPTPVPGAGDPAGSAAGGGAPAGAGSVGPPSRDITTTEIPTESEGPALAGLPGLVIATLPLIGSRAGSALRDRNAGPVREGESQGTGDLGIGGIKIGRPPTALGVASGLRVPAQPSRNDTVLWTVPGALFDLIRDPVSGFLPGDRSSVPASRLALLGWRLGGVLPTPPESSDPPG